MSNCEGAKGKKSGQAEDDVECVNHERKGEERQAN